MLNYETLLSSYDDKLTLMQWLKKVEEALKDASAVSFKVNKRGDATLTFSVVFEDGSELETDPIILQQGESVQAATIRNGHLILTLTNGDELDAGDLGGVSGFSIDASQHLIVTYQNGTTQDLGAIFSGNVVISGNFEVTGLAKLPSIEGDENGDINVDGDIVISDGGISIADGAVSTPILTSANDYIEAQKPVIEVMNGFNLRGTSADVNFDYIGVVKNGNKLTFAIVGSLNLAAQPQYNQISMARIDIPNSVSTKIKKITAFLSEYNIVSVFKTFFASSNSAGVDIVSFIQKTGDGSQDWLAFTINTSPLSLNTNYVFRMEQTFLLSDNLAA